MQELPGGQSSSLVKRMKVSSAVFVMDVVEKVRTVCVFLSEAGMHTQHVAGRCRDTQLSSVDTNMLQQQEANDTKTEIVYKGG